MVALHTAIAIVLVVALIIKAKVDPVISLVIACLYLGLAAGVGFEKTIKATTEGFGDIMAKVGLLIGFGVLIGSLLYATGAFRKMVKALLSAVGAKRLPYAMTVAMSMIFPSIYVDVQVVLASPVARSTAPHIGSRGLPLERAGHRHLRRLRLRHPRPRRDLRRRPARGAAGHVAPLRHRHRPDHGRPHDAHHADPPARQFLEARARRGARRGDASPNTV